MPGTAEERLLAVRGPNEEEPKVVGRARRPHANQVSMQLMGSERWVPLVLVEVAQRLDEAALVLAAELGERLEELGGESEGPVGASYPWPRADRLTGGAFPARRAYRPRTRSSSLS